MYLMEACNKLLVSGGSSIPLHMALWRLHALCLYTKCVVCTFYKGCSVNFLQSVQFSLFTDCSLQCLEYRNGTKPSMILIDSTIPVCLFTAGNLAAGPKPPGLQLSRSYKFSQFSQCLVKSVSYDLNGFIYFPMGLKRPKEYFICIDCSGLVQMGLKWVPFGIYLVSNLFQCNGKGVS